MFGTFLLTPSHELRRHDLPQVVRPFWALSRLRTGWADPFQRPQLIARCHDLLGLGFDTQNEARMLRELEAALESGRLVMLDHDAVTFDPVAAKRGDRIELLGEGHRDAPGFTQALATAFQRRREGGRRQAVEAPAQSSRPLTFEESVAANNKFFGQPVSAVSPVPKKPSPPPARPLVLHFEMDIHAPANRNDRLILRTTDGAWSQTIEVLDMNYVQDHWLELVFEGAPQDGVFELIQDPCEPGRTPFFVFRNLSYAELDDPAPPSSAVA